MSKQKKSSYQIITSNLAQLSETELLELREAVNALLEATSASPPIESKLRVKTPEEVMRHSYEQAKAGQKPTKGYVEQKMINGYGPYLYLRFWHEGKLKSLYIGKKESYE